MSQHSRAQDGRAATFAGIALVGTGLTHFVAPQLFEPITKPAFPRDTRRHLYINGGIETALGIGLSLRQTRKLALAGSIGYVAYLAGNALRNR